MERTRFFDNGQTRAQERVAEALVAFAVGITLTGCTESGDQVLVPCYTADQNGSVTEEFSIEEYGSREAAIAACNEAATSGGGTAVMNGSSGVEFDVDILLQPLAAFGGLYDRMLGVSLDLITWNPASSDTCYVGYNAVGGEEDWLAEHCVLYVDEILEIDGDGDGTADARFAAVEFDQSTQPYLGNLLNVGNPDCWDTSSDYYTLDGCWAKIYVVGGDDYTAWVGTGTNIGDFELSVYSDSDGLRPGPDNGTY